MRADPAPRLDLTSLRWSVAVASNGGFRKAADAIGVEQSALSRRVRALEDEIGVSLFHRSPGGATLTFAGVSFIKGVEHALGLLNETVNEAQEAGRGRLGRLRIGLTGSFLSDTLFGFLQHFRGAHPNVQIEMITGEAGEHLSAVADRRIDIAVLPGNMTVSGLDVSELWRESLHVILPETHALASKAVIELEQLTDVPVLISEGDLGQDVPLRARHLDTVNLKIIDAGLPILLAQVQLGLGLAIVASGALRQSGVPPHLVQRPLHSGEGLTVGFAAAWYHRNDNPALRRFVSSTRGTPRLSSNAS